MLMGLWQIHALACPMVEMSKLLHTAWALHFTTSSPAQAHLGRTEPNDGSAKTSKILPSHRLALLIDLTLTATHDRPQVQGLME